MTLQRRQLWAVLLAGGQGERLWPWSRQACPKQFLPLVGRQSLLQAAYARLTRLVPRGQVFVIGGAAHAGLVRRQLPRLPRDRWVGEPVGRNTAAAVGLGALLIGREDPGAVIVVATADHLIAPTSQWAACVRAAAGLALEDVDRLVCLGIRPTSPHPGYGYLVPSRARRRLPGGRWAAPLARYVEKPSRRMAQRLIRAGAYWNSGMFIVSLPAIARALQRHLPAIARALVSTIRAQVGTRAFAAELRRAYARLPSISMDYGIMEHAEDRWVVPATFGWDDVGSWTMLWRWLPRDGAANAVRGLHAGVATRRTLVVGEPGRVIATLGVKDLVIVQRGDATLVASRAAAPRLKTLVTRLHQRPAWRRYL